MATRLRTTKSAERLRVTRSPEGVTTAKETWLEQLAGADVEIRRERESQDYARRLAEPGYKRIAEMNYARTVMESVLRLREILAKREQEQTVEAVEKQFRALAQQWLQETKYLSDPVRQFLHPVHLKIIAMGEKILPLVLREVQKMSGHWFLVLNAISPENPVKPEDEKSIQRVTNAWLEWGKEKGLIETSKT